MAIDRTKKNIKLEVSLDELYLMRHMVEHVERRLKAIKKKKSKSNDDIAFLDVFIVDEKTLQSLGSGIGARNYLD